MTKIYVATPNKDIEKKIVMSLITYFGDEVRVFGEIDEKDKSAYDIYENEKSNILSSQILICALDETRTENVTRAVSMFTSSLDTLKELGLGHTPKMVIGLPMFDELEQLSNSMLFNIGAIYDWGTMAHSQEDMLELVANYIDGNPLF